MLKRAGTEEEVVVVEEEDLNLTIVVAGTVTVG